MHTEVSIQIWSVPVAPIHVTILSGLLSPQRQKRSGGGGRECINARDLAIRSEIFIYIRNAHFVKMFCRSKSKPIYHRVHARAPHVTRDRAGACWWLDSGVWRRHRSSSPAAAAAAVAFVRSSGADGERRTRAVVLLVRAAYGTRACCAPVMTSINILHAQCTHAPHAHRRAKVCVQTRRRGRRAGRVVVACGCVVVRERTI